MMFRRAGCTTASRLLRQRMSTLVYAEHGNGKLNEASNCYINAAEKFGEPITVLVAGKGSRGAAEEASKIAGVSAVLHVDSDSSEHQLAENLTNTILKVQEAHSFKQIIAGATANGKNIIPRVAAALDVAPISDVIAIASNDTFVRPIYAGNALCTVQSCDPVKVMTVRATSFEKAGTSDSEASVEDFEAGASNSTKWISNEISVSERPDLAGAGIVVSGGRGVGSMENFSVVNELADSLGAAVGASRAAVDAGYAANDMQVGQTGKVVAPDLYIAVGISGAIQHLAGMKDSKTIVAINKDADAPIFQISDYGVVGDLFKVVPDLTAKIRA